jgi:hypothetical protein
VGKGNKLGYRKNEVFLWYPGELIVLFHMQGLRNNMTDLSYKGDKSLDGGEHSYSIPKHPSRGEEKWSSQVNNLMLSPLTLARLERRTVHCFFYRPLKSSSFNKRK